MNRTLALGLLATVLVWFVLLGYDTASSTVLDQVIATFIAVLYLGVCVHMLVDRKLAVWSASAVGIFLGAIGWIALFSRFEYGWAVGRLSPGESQGWLDLVRACVLVGGPMLAVALIQFRLETRRTGQPSRPGELLLIDTPQYHGPERRGTTPGRRSTDYDRDRGDRR